MAERQRQQYNDSRASASIVTEVAGGSPDEASVVAAHNRIMATNKKDQ